MPEEKIITLDEFKNLVPIDNLNGCVSIGKFAFRKTTHELMVKNSQIGDKVFYHETTLLPRKESSEIVGSVCSAVLVA